VKVLVMMSGGVDSSVAAALVRDQGHHVVGVTLKLWGGESDSGCCSISDVDDARRAADRLGIDHHTFDFGDEFTRHVVSPYAAAHVAGHTPNPCIECNRHIKFAAVDQRARLLGFDAVATGHHARIVTGPDGSRRLARGADRAKDQSYVLHVLDADQLARTQFPIGHLTKAEVRAHATRLGLRTATKPDSQDVCFITKATGRRAFLGERVPLTPARVVDTGGQEVGQVSAVELVTLGQRRGLGLAGGGRPRYVIDVDRGGPEPLVVVGGAADLLVEEQTVRDWRWIGTPPARTGSSAGTSSPDLHDAAVGVRAEVQTSAHGDPHPAELVTRPSPDGAPAVVVRWTDPQRRVAPGQSVVAYQGDEVVGGGIAG
jgi:tRNA-specific 2-thiouridylase